MRFLSILTGLILIMPCLVCGQTPLVWQRSYGTEVYNYGIKSIALPDTGYIILSNESSDIGNTAIRLIRIDRNGIIKWQKVLGDGTLRWGNDFLRVHDGAYVIAGNVYDNVDEQYDMLLMKTDSAGNILWQRSAGGPDWDMGNALVMAPDSGFLVVGETYSYGGNNGNVFAVKFNSSGDTLWTRVLGGDSSDYAASVDLMADSNYLIGANTRSAGAGDYDGWVIKLSPNGDSLWSQCYGDTLEDRLYSIKTTPDKGFVFVGYTYNYGAQNTEIWLVRADSLMNFMWRLPEFWNVSPADDVAFNVSLNDSAHFVISGYTTTSAGNGGKEMLIEIMGEWNTYKSSNSFGSIEDEECRHAIQTLDKGYLLTGESGGQGPSIENIYLVKTGPNCQSVINCIYTTGTAEAGGLLKGALNVYPNPSDGKAIISWPALGDAQPEMIRVYDAAGRTVFDGNRDNCQSGTRCAIDLSGFPAGLYLVAIVTDTTLYTQKLILR